MTDPDLPWYTKRSDIPPLVRKPYTPAVAPACEPRPAHAKKVKVTEAGQPCRHCGTPVVRSEHKPGKQLKRNPSGYFYDYWFACPNKHCRALYMVEAAKRWYDRPGETLDAFDTTPADSMVPK